MKTIPKQQPSKLNRIAPANPKKLNTNDNLKFSFELLETNEYFNFDGTCVNWTKDLFNILKQVSNIEVKSILAGKFSGRNSTLRIHSHENASPPCDIPKNVDLDEFWQIRVSKSKGGIHGIFLGNIFYIIWVDPQHNMYPDSRYGGLKVIKPPMNCCKDRDIELKNLHDKIKAIEEDAKFWEEIATSKE